MSDLISRHAVMNRIENEYREWGDEYDVPQILGDIEDFPSAEPERKRGQWIYKDGVRGFGLGAWCCSECGEENESLPFHKCKDPYEYAASKYCACCGAKMEAEHETD